MKIHQLQYAALLGAAVLVASLPKLVALTLFAWAFQIYLKAEQPKWWEMLRTEYRKQSSRLIAWVRCTKAEGQNHGYERPFSPVEKSDGE